MSAKTPVDFKSTRKHIHVRYVKSRSSKTNRKSRVLFPAERRDSVRHVIRWRKAERGCRTLLSRFT